MILQPLPCASIVVRVILESFEAVSNWLCCNGKRAKGKDGVELREV